MNKGGYAHIKRGVRPDLTFTDDPKPISQDSAWMANVERWLIHLWHREYIAGYESEWVGGKRGAQRFNLLTNPVGNGSIGLDYQMTLFRDRTNILPCLNMLWDEVKPHGIGVFHVYIEVKGLLTNGGVLHKITEADFTQLEKAERSNGGRENSALKLKRFRDKYPEKIAWVVGGREYKAIKTGYAASVPNWED